METPWDLLPEETTDYDRVARIQHDQDERMLRDLVEYRRRQGLTQADVAELMGVTQGAVARIESGNRDCHQSTLRRYAIAVVAVVEHRVRPLEDVQTEQLDRLASVHIHWRVPTSGTNPSRSDPDFSFPPTPGAGVRLTLEEGLFGAGHA